MSAVVKLIVGLVLFALTFLICYLGGAFYSVSFNIAEWADGTRFFVVMMGMAMGGYLSSTPFLLGD